MFDSMDASASATGSQISSPVDFMVAALHDAPPKFTLKKPHLEDIKEMEAAGFIAEWLENPPLVRCHTAGFAALLANDPSRLPSYKTTSDGSNPLEQNAYALPLNDGGWRLHRYGGQEGEGWTKNRKDEPCILIPPRGGKRKKPSIEAIDGYIRQRHRLVCSDKKDPFAIFVRKGRQLVSRLDDQYGAMLAADYLDENGQALDGSLLSNVLRIARQRALDGDKHVIRNRVAMHGGEWFLDLGGESREVVNASKDGWRIAAQCPVLFARGLLTTELPRPAKHNGLDELRTLLNVDDAGWQSIRAFLIGAWNPLGPAPLLVLTGTNGSAKSTAARILQSIIDPKQDESLGRENIFAPPKDARDLLVVAMNNYLLCFDNLSKISDELSQALCRLSTGGSQPARKLYSDAGLVSLSSMNPVIITSINSIVEAEDLRSRSLFVELERPAKFIGEQELWAKLQEMRPRIIAAMLDLVVNALRNWDSTEPLENGRLTDSSKWILAADPNLRDSLAASAREAAERSLESDDVAEAMTKVEAGNYSASELLIALQRLNTSIVCSAKSLGHQLKRLAPELQTLGVVVKRKRSNSGTTWSVER